MDKDNYLKVLNIHFERLLKLLIGCVLFILKLCLYSHDKCSMGKSITNFYFNEREKENEVDSLHKFILGCTHNNEENHLFSPFPIKCCTANSVFFRQIRGRENR